MSKNLSSILRASAVTNIVGGTAGQVHYQSSTDTTAFTATGTSGQVLTSAGTAAPSWTSQTGLSVGTATNVAGGAAGNVHYQSGAGATSFVTNGTSGQVLTSNGAAAPTWSTPASGLPTQTGNSGKYLTTDGSTASWGTVSGGATITNDSTTNSSFYPVFTSVTSGTMSAASVSTSKMYFNPSTGVLSATLFNSLSDANFKTNVVPVRNGLEVVKSIDAVEYDWIDGGEHSSGVIAQQLETVLPFLVATSEKGEKSVNYSGLIAYLIGAVKELSEKVEVLENR